MNVGYEKQVNIENEKSFFFSKIRFFLYISRRRKTSKRIESYWRRTLKYLSLVTFHTHIIIFLLCKWQYLFKKYIYVCSFLFFRLSFWFIEINIYEQKISIMSGNLPRWTLVSSILWRNRFYLKIIFENKKKKNLIK